MPAGPDGRPTSLVKTDGLPAEGYRIVIDATEGVKVTAGDEAGFFYGQATLAQLSRVFETVHGHLVPAGTIEDWPDLAVMRFLDPTVRHWTAKCLIPAAW